MAYRDTAELGSALRGVAGPPIGARARGVVTDYPGLEVARCISAGGSACLRQAEKFGFDRIVVHLDWNTAYFGPTSGIQVVSPDAALAYLLAPQPHSSRPIARSRRSRVAVGGAGSVSFWVHVRSRPGRQDRFLSFDRFYVQLNRENFFGIYSPSRHVWSPGPVLPRSPADYLTLTWSRGRLQLWVNGMRYGRALPFRGPTPRHVQVIPPGSAPGTTRASSGVVHLAVPHESCGIIPCRLRGGVRALEWGKYLVLVSLSHATPLLSSQPCGSGAPAAALPALVEGGTFAIGRGGCERVGFLETYDTSWTLTAMSPGARVIGHRTADHYSNQWTVTGPAGAVYALRYSTTPSLLAASSAGALTGGVYLSSVFGAGAVLRGRRLGRHVMAQRRLVLGSRHCAVRAMRLRLRAGQPDPGRHSPLRVGPACSGASCSPCQRMSGSSANDRVAESQCDT